MFFRKKETPGRRLKRLMLEADMTCQELAAAANLSINTITNLRQDKHLPQYHTAEQVCDVLGCNLQDIWEHL